MGAPSRRSWERGSVGRSALPAARLVAGLDFHSLAMLELAFSLEDEFDLPTADEATSRGILTVVHVVQHVSAALRPTDCLIE